MDHTTQRWHVAIGFALVIAGGGLLVGSPIVLVAAMVPLGVVLYGSVSAVPSVGQSVSCQRHIRPTQTYAGELVTVELTVHNTSDQLLADLRVVDGVPAALAVVDGSPRAGVTLDGGEETTIEYTVRARYGGFEFGPLTARTHSVSTTNTDTVDLSVDGDTQIRAMYEPDAYPLAKRTLPITGTVLADRGDEGLEFHSIRAYEPGDPASRINWRQYARERELSTIEYRPEEATEALIIVDVRPSAAQARSETDPTGTELCCSLAGDIVDSLLADRNRVGVLTVGLSDAPVGETTDGSHSQTPSAPWVPPANNQQTRTEIELLLDAAAATVQPGAASRDNGAFNTSPVEIIERLSLRTQVLIVSPLADQYPVELSRQLAATGHTVSVYSPAVCSQSSAGGQLQTTQRTLRINELRAHNIDVIDWNTDEPLAVAFNRSRRLQRESYE